jgi:hypothetical protein
MTTEYWPPFGVDDGAITSSGLTMATARLLGRTTASSGAVEEITVGSGLSLVNGELLATGSGAGSVTTVSVVSTNGFAGTVATANTTPAITLTTTITGLLKGNGTAISAAVADTDYLTPGTAASTYQVIGSYQPLDSDLTALAALAATGGMLSRTGAGAFAVRSIAGTASRVSVSNGDGVAGAPTINIDAAYDALWQPVDADLTALAALSTTGMMARTASNTYTMRTVTGTASRISVTNGNGVSGNPTLDIDAAYDALWQPVDADLTAIAALDATAGYLVKTAANTYARRTLTGTTNRVTVSNGNGTTGNPVIDVGTDVLVTGGALGTPASGNLGSCTADGTDAVGFRNIPQNSKSAAYTLVLADAGKHIYHPSADTTARIWTIPANASVAYPIGTAITFVNDTSGGVITIAITTDTLVLAGAGTTGSRTLAANGVATAIKVTATRWIISGTGLT